MAVAHVIFGNAYDETLGDQLRVIVTATGLSSARKSRPGPPLAVVQQLSMHAVQQPRARANHGSAGQHSTPQQQHNYEGLSTPSGWRTNRTDAAAKVDALASSGMDEIEIPAFLRKQAD